MVFDTSLLTDEAEINLAKSLTQVKQSNLVALAKGDYQQALQDLSQLAVPLDQFFSDIMVMADDEALKNNRLALLAELQVELGQVADISLLTR
jgi:glycyl-tRNA synthetase beta chain